MITHASVLAAHVDMSGELQGQHLAAHAHLVISQEGQWGSKEVCCKGDSALRAFGSPNKMSQNRVRPVPQPLQGAWGFLRLSLLPLSRSEDGMCIDSTHAKGAGACMPTACQVWPALNATSARPEQRKAGGTLSPQAGVLWPLRSWLRRRAHRHLRSIADVSQGSQDPLGNGPCVTHLRCCQAGA